MNGRSAAKALWLGYPLAVIVLVAAFFYVPARTACRGDWPAPLDDVYIHYDFARALATGHPFEWIAGQGYSSGETSPAYAFVLAVGYVAGFHGDSLGVWGAVVAVSALLYAAWTLGRLVAPDSRWPVFGVPLLLFSCGTLDSAYWSGMEVALFAALAALLLQTAHRAREAPGEARPRLQWLTGGVGALLVLTRPESVTLVAVVSVVVARRSGEKSSLLSCVRVALPGALATLSIAALNRVFTGEAASAGATLKLLSSNPFATAEDAARDYLVTVALFVRAMCRDFDGEVKAASALAALIALASLGPRRTRGLGVVCLGGGVSFVLLAACNGAARYQNLRNFMPAMTLFSFAMALGVGALRSVGVGRILAPLLAIGVAGFGGPGVARAAKLYARASRNIHDQQVAVGRMLAATSPRDAIVLVGDAGAIPYESRLHAVDALGLGGYHGMPFVRAAVNGEGATLELIERLPLRDRPTLLALYPNWFPAITTSFGHEKGRVTIDDNVICGGSTKVVYDADWSPLAGPGGEAAPMGFGGAVLLDELDVADVVSEEAHGYISPAPIGGFTIVDIRNDGATVRRFDAGRIIPEGREESFAVTRATPAGTELLIRSDDSRADVTVHVAGEGRGDTAFPLSPDASSEPGHWRLRRGRLVVALAPRDRVRLVVDHGTLHDFHAWLVGENP